MYYVPVVQAVQWHEGDEPAPIECKDGDYIVSVPGGSHMTAVSAEDFESRYVQVDVSPPGATTNEPADSGE